MNSFDAIGYIGPIIEREYREVEIQLPTFDRNNSNTVKIFARYWAGGDRNYFLTQPNYSQVSIHGHLENDEKFGIIIVAQDVTCLKK